MYLIISGSSIISGAEFVLKDYLIRSSLHSQLIILSSDTIETHHFFSEIPVAKILFSPLLGHVGVIKTGRLQSWLKKGLRYLKSKKLFDKILSDNKIEAVIGNNAGDVIYSRIIKSKEASIKFFLHVHEMIERKSMLGNALKLFDRYVDRYIAVSRAVQEKLTDLGINELKVEIIYNGLEYTKRVKKNKDEHQNIFGFIGSIEEHKRPMSFVTFLKELSTKTRAVYQAYMAYKHANGTILQKITDEIIEYNVHLELIGEVKRNNINNFYEKIDYLFVPFINDSFPTVILEAFNNGVPVIGRNSGGIPEIVTHRENGFLFDDEGDFKEITDDLISLSSKDYWILSENANLTIKDKFNITQKQKRFDELLSPGTK